MTDVYTDLTTCCALVQHLGTMQLIILPINAQYQKYFPVTPLNTPSGLLIGGHELRQPKKLQDTKVALSQTHGWEGQKEVSLKKKWG